MYCFLLIRPKEIGKIFLKPCLLEIPYPCSMTQVCCFVWRS